MPKSWRVKASSYSAGALNRTFYGWGYKICCKKRLVMKIFDLYGWI